MIEYFVSADPGLLDHDFIVRSLHSTYWAFDRPKEVVEKSLLCSLCFGAYLTGTKEQVGFARVVTDRATISWVCDVFVDPKHRACGLGKRLISEIVGHPDLAATMMILGTKDAHGLYGRFGFERRKMMQRRLRNLPNQQAPDPTPVAVTPAADAPVVPSSGAAHF
jgi:GNAT superfamily N-acetyltransferase